MDLGLKGKVAVVTGADGGLGLAIATGFASEGARVALVSRTTEKGNAAACEIRGSVRGADAEAFAADLTYGPAVEGLAEAVREHFGVVQILVNAAGGVAEFATFDELDDDAWTKGLDLNLMTAVRTIRAFLPDMRARQWGRIINIASEDGIQPYSAVPHYSAAKAGLLALSKSLSKHLAKDGILVNAVSPAFVMTPLVKRMLDGEAEKLGVDFDTAKQRFLDEKRPHIELKRPGEPDEIAAAVLFLASERASFVLGANLRVDGGSVPSI